MMTREEIDQKLDKVNDELFKVEKADTRLRILDHELEVLDEKILASEKKLQKEYEDVKKIEKLTTGKLITRVLRKRKFDLEKERDEYLEAVLQYNNLKNEEEILHFEVKLLKRVRNRKSRLNKKKRELLAEKEKLFANGDISEVRVLRKFDAKREVLLNKIRELKEVLEVIDELLSQLQSLAKDIQRAKPSLSMLYNFGVGNYQLHQFMKRGREAITNINHLIERVNKEVLDVYDTPSNINTFRYEKYVQALYHALKTGMPSTSILRGVDFVKQIERQATELQKQVAADIDTSKDLIGEVEKEKRFYLENL